MKYKEVDRHRLASAVLVAVASWWGAGCGGGGPSNKERLESSRGSLADAEMRSPRQVEVATPATQPQPDQLVDKLAELVEQRARELAAAQEATAKRRAAKGAEAPTDSAAGAQANDARPPAAPKRPPAMSTASRDSLIGGIADELNLDGSPKRETPAAGAPTDGRQDAEAHKAPSAPEEPGTASKVQSFASANTSDEPDAARSANPSAAPAGNEAVSGAASQPSTSRRVETRGNEAPDDRAMAASAKEGQGQDVLLRRLQQQAKDNPRDLASQLNMQLYKFLSGDPAPDLSAIASLPAEDREVVSAIVDGLSNFRNTVQADANLLMNQKIKPLTDIARRLQNQTELAIPTLALCSRVTTFGVYEPLAPRFVAGNIPPFRVYCEVENFSTRLSDKGMWQTELSQELVLYNEKGETAWQEKPQAIRDLSRNRRHDFYTFQVVQLPRALPAGHYVLKVTVTDTQNNRVAENSQPIEILARPTFN